VVLDPFAGIGTVGEAAVRLGRRFVLAESDPGYVGETLRRAAGWLGPDAKDLTTIGCAASATGLEPVSASSPAQAR
jgi:DNA modification methylase